MKTVGGCELTLKLDGDKVTVTDEPRVPMSRLLMLSSQMADPVIDKVLFPKT